MYKLAVFDLDGTILDTIEDLADALNHTLELYSYPLKSLEETRAMVGRGLRNLLRSATSVSDGEKLDSMLSELVSFYSAHSAVKTRP
ncbi:MAG: HAD hydrolase-like protein, partial [Oscillospiraceae bacterium]|nr:HAD hydrolase-like protein [Oscillospiraceae bacterium]